MIIFDKWFQIDKLPKHTGWTMLTERKVEYNDVIGLAECVAPDLSLDDALFDEVSQLNSILAKIPDDVFSKQTIEEKWLKIFKSVDDRQPLPSLYKLVSIILAVPVSNAFVERVFSLSNAQWTKERNLLQAESVKALLQVIVNYDFTCTEMHKYILDNKKLLKGITGGEKY